MDKKDLLYDIFKNPKFYGEQFSKKLKELPHKDIPLFELENNITVKKSSEEEKQLKNAISKINTYIKLFSQYKYDYLLKKKIVMNNSEIIFKANSNKDVISAKKNIKEEEYAKKIIDIIDDINTGKNILDYKKYKIDFPQIDLNYDKKQGILNSTSKKYDFLKNVLDNIEKEFIKTTNVIIDKLGKIIENDFKDLKVYYKLESIKGELTNLKTTIINDINVNIDKEIVNYNILVKEINELEDQSKGNKTKLNGKKKELSDKETELREEETKLINKETNTLNSNNTIVLNNRISQLNLTILKIDENEVNNKSLLDIKKLIKRKYLKASLIHHPNKGGKNGNFIILTNESTKLLNIIDNLEKDIKGEITKIKIKIKGIKKEIEKINKEIEEMRKKNIGNTTNKKNNIIVIITSINTIIKNNVDIFINKIISILNTIKPDINNATSIENIIANVKTANSYVTNINATTKKYTNTNTSILKEIDNYELYTNINNIFYGIFSKVDDYVTTFIKKLNDKDKISFTKNIIIDESKEIFTINNNKQGTVFKQSNDNYFQWIDFVSLKLPDKSSFKKIIKDGINNTLSKLSDTFFGITSNNETKQNFINAKEDFFNSNYNQSSINQPSSNQASSNQSSSNQNNSSMSELKTLTEKNKAGLALRGQILHKRRIINEYIVPICYLIYSFIFMKYYYFQKRRSVKVVGDINYKMYEYIFDYKNPIIKKVNVFIYKNVKDSIGTMKNNISSDYDPELFKKMQDYKTNCFSHFDKIKKAISEKENLDINFKSYKNLLDLLKNLIGDIHKIVLLMVQIYKNNCIVNNNNNIKLFKETSGDDSKIIKKNIYLDTIIYLCNLQEEKDKKKFGELTSNTSLEKILTSELKIVLQKIIEEDESLINSEQDENFIVKINRMGDEKNYNIYDKYKNEYRVIIDTYQNILKTIQKINLEKVELQITYDKENDIDELLLDETNINLRKVFQVYRYYNKKYYETFNKKEEEKKTNSLLDYIKKNINSQIEIYQDLFDYLNKTGKTNLKEIKKEKFDKFYNEINNIYAKINFAILYILHFNEKFLINLKIDTIDSSKSNFLKLNFKNNKDTNHPDITKYTKIKDFSLDIESQIKWSAPVDIINFPYKLFHENEQFYEKMDNSFKHLISYLYFSFIINKYTENLYFALILNKSDEPSHKPLLFKKDYADKLIEDIKFQFVNKVRDYKKKNKIKVDNLLLFLDQKINKINYENQSIISNINSKEKEYSIKKETELLEKEGVKKKSADADFEQVEKEYIKKSNEQNKMNQFYDNLSNTNIIINKTKLVQFLNGIKGYLLSSLKSSDKEFNAYKAKIFTKNFLEAIPVLPNNDLSLEELINSIDKTSNNLGIKNYKLLEIIFDFFETKFQGLQKINKEDKYKEINNRFVKEFLQAPDYNELKGKYITDYKQTEEDFKNSFMTKNINKMKDFFMQNEIECKMRLETVKKLKKSTSDQFNDIERTIKKKEDKKKIFELKKANIPILKKKIEDEIEKVTKLKRSNNSNTQVDSFKTDFLNFFNDTIEITKLFVEKIDKKSFSKEQNQLYFLYKKDDLFKKQFERNYLIKFTDKNKFIPYWLDTDGDKRDNFLKEINLYFQNKGEFIVQLRNSYNVNDPNIMNFFEKYEIQYNDIVSKIKDVLQKINNGMLILGKNNHTKVDIFINEIIYEKKNRLFKILDDIEKKKNYNYNSKNVRGSIKVVLPYTDVMLLYFINLLIIYDYFSFFYE